MVAFGRGDFRIARPSGFHLFESPLAAGFAAISTKSFMTDPLSLRLKTLIVATLKLDDVRPEDLPDDEPLIGSPRFGLDSIDALELVLAVEKEFGVKIGSSEESRQALASVRALGDYLRTRQAGA